MRKVRVEKDYAHRGNYWNVVIKNGSEETVAGTKLPYTEAYQLKLKLEAKPQVFHRPPLVLI